METVFLWVIFSFVIGVAADGRGRSGIGWFVLSLIISPVLTLILIALLPKKTADAATITRPASRKTKRCPLCAEDILAEAIKCKHCGADISATSEPSPSPLANPVADLALHGITYDEGKFVYCGYRYDKVEDAIAYAELEKAKKN